MKRGCVERVAYVLCCGTSSRTVHAGEGAQELGVPLQERGQIDRQILREEVQEDMGGRPRRARIAAYASPALGAGLAPAAHSAR